MDIALAQKIIAAVIADYEGEYELTESGGKMTISLVNRSVHAETTHIKPYWIDGNDQALSVHIIDNNGEMSPAIYSLRCITDVVAYCSMLATRYELRAKRQRP